MWPVCSWVKCTWVFISPVTLPYALMTYPTTVYLFKGLNSQKKLQSWIFTIRTNSSSLCFHPPTPSKKIYNRIFSPENISVIFVGETQFYAVSDCRSPSCFIPSERKEARLNSFLYIIQILFPFHIHASRPVGTVRFFKFITISVLKSRVIFQVRTFFGI